MSQHVHLHHGRKSKVDINDSRITAGSGVGPTAVDENDPGISLDAAKVSASAGKMKVELTGPDEALPPDGELIITLIDLLGAPFNPPAPSLDVTYDADPGLVPLRRSKKKKTPGKKTSKKPAKKKTTQKKTTKKKPAKKPAKKRRKK